MTCNCDNDESNEYIIELNQQGAPGVKGEKGEQGYSPTVSYISDDSGIVINIVNEQDTISTPILPLKTYVDTLSDTKMNTDGSNAASSVKFNNITFSYTGATQQAIRTINRQELLIAGQGLYLQGHASQAQGYPNSITIAPRGTSISIGNASKHTIVVDNDGASYDGNEIATINQIPSITGKLNTDGSNATNTFTVNGVELAGNYVYMNSVSSGGISVTQSNSDIFAKLQVDSSIAQLRMPGLYLNSGATGNITLNTTRDIVINGSNTSNKMYYHGTSADNEIATLGDITGTSYTAGNGIDITNDTISVDNTILTTNTAQTVTGDKTFSADIHLDGAGIKLDTTNAFIRGKSASGNTYRNIIARSIGSSEITIGNQGDGLKLAGKLPYPKYNNVDMALLTDIPTVGNGTITINQGGTTKGTFTLNQSGNTTINLDAGGSGGGAVDSVNGQTGTVVLTASDVGALPNTTVIPTKTSDLTNDSGFITSADLPTNYVTTDTAQTITGLKTFSGSIKTNTVYNTNSNPMLQIYNSTIRVGNSNYGLKLLGDSTRPEYSMDGGRNYNQLALLADVPSITLREWS